MSSKSRIEQLPLEAKQAILSSLTDIASLKSATLTSRSFYHAFKSAEELITTSVLSNEVDGAVIPEALIAQESLVWSKPHIFAAKHLQTRVAINPHKRFKLKDISGRGVVKYVNYFAADFARKALEGKGPGLREPTREELNRIRRTFYRFEIYRNIFKPFDDQAPAALFFNRFSPWENEQVACVHDYLVSLITPIFDDIVEHDVAWGEYCVRYAEDANAGYVQHLLSLGLERLYEMVTAKSYESRYKLIYSKHPPTRQFLVEGLNAAYPRGSTGPFPIHALHSHVMKSFFEDPDTGPVHVWRWAHQNIDRAQNLVNSKSRRSLREWGYVMWDRARLDEMGIFDSLWSRSPEVIREDVQRGMDRTTKSMWLPTTWERRQLIFMAGGTGWWSKEDESRVEWPRDRSPWDSEEKRRDCVFCIGDVKCAPHRLILRI